jgi:hypothetical protein
MLALTEGDISEREIEKRKPTRRNQDQPSERKRRNGNDGFKALKQEGKGGQVKSLERR